MNFSKLLCLVLVYSQQFGQVLTEVQTEETCSGDDTQTVTCKRKKGETVKLTIKGAVTSDVVWKKGTTTIEALADKYELDNANNKILTIKALAEGDEGEYTASTSPAQKFQVQVVPVCEGSQSEKVTCKGKPGGELELKSAAVSGPYKWKKNTEEITADAAKYSGLDAKAMTIMKLEDTDEGEYKGTPTDQGIVVQVATICTGSSSSSPKACVGTLNKDLVLKVGSPATKKVDWKKGGTPVSGDKYVKSGTDDIALRITNLAADDAGTYTAAYDKDTADTQETFTVKIAETKGTDESGGGRGNTTDTVVVHNKKPGGGGGSVLSYSPALLVTVTLVHLLLQLAA